MIRRKAFKFMGKPFYGHPRFYKLIMEMAKTHSIKNRGYAKASDPLSNFRKCQEAGISMVDGIYVRMSDKWCRFTNLLPQRENSLAGESIKDTLLDLAVYALIEIIALEEEERR